MGKKFQHIIYAIWGVVMLITGTFSNFLGWFYGLIFLRKIKTYDEIVKVCQTPFQVHAYTQYHFHYVKEVNDEPYDYKHPLKMLDTKAGDCDDYALFDMTILSQNYDTYYLEMWSDKEGHAVCYIPSIRTTLGNLGIFNHKSIKTWDVCKDYFKDLQGYILYNNDLVRVEWQTK